MGGGKAPISFLNKKPWHPSRPQNMEEVWKREQKAAAEAQKLDEIRKQYEEERRHQEFAAIAESAGYKKQERLDWMYAGGLAAKEDAAKRQDEALLGQRPATLAAPGGGGELARVEGMAQLPSPRAAAAPVSQNEQWNRLNNDPLLLIKKQQQEALLRVRENPVRMQEIIKQVQQEKVSKEEKKRAKKDKKKHKKEHKRHRKGRHSGSSSSNSDSDEGDRARGRAEPRVFQHHSNQHDRTAQGACFDAERMYDHARHVGSTRDAGSGYQGRVTAAAGGGLHEGNRKRARSPSPRDRPYSKHGDAYDGRAAPGARGEGEGARRNTGPRSSHGDLEADGFRQHTGCGGYGLSHSTTAPEAVLRSDRSTNGAETRARLEEAARQQEQKELEKVSQRLQRTEYKAGRVTDEERQRRLAEMSANAGEHEAQRLERIKQSRAADEASNAGALANKGGVAGTSREGDAFIKAASQEVFAALQAPAGALESRINSRKNMQERR